MANPHLYLQQLGQPSQRLRKSPKETYRLLCELPCRSTRFHQGIYLFKLLVQSAIPVLVRKRTNKHFKGKLFTFSKLKYVTYQHESVKPSAVSVKQVLLKIRSRLNKSFLIMSLFAHNKLDFLLELKHGWIKQAMFLPSLNQLQTSL